VFDDLSTPPLKSEGKDELWLNQNMAVLSTSPEIEIYFSGNINEHQGQTEQDIKITRTPKSPVKMIKDKLKGYKLSPADFHKTFDLEEETSIKTYNCHYKLVSSVTVIGTIFVTQNYLCYSSKVAERLKPKHKVAVLLGSIDSIVIRKEYNLDVTATTTDGIKTHVFNHFEDTIYEIRQYLWDLVQKSRSPKGGSGSESLQHTDEDDVIAGNLDM